MSDIQIPVIDISKFVNGTAEEKAEIVKQVNDGCIQVGFLTIVNHGVPNQVIENIWKSTKNFFDSSIEEKEKLIFPQEKYPFGYNPMGSEILSKGKDAENGTDNEASTPPDIKEMFSIGPNNLKTGLPLREFPKNPSDFEETWSTYYEELNKLAQTILRIFALALNLEENFFDKFTNNHASALRGINYPEIISRSEVLKNQCRASAHTDYGTITILKTDGPGLQVSKDITPPVWVDVPHIADGFIINLGDLMKRWTNDRWLSTLHRVVVPDSDLVGAGENSSNIVCRRRQSLAFFHNINRDAIVEVILKDANEVVKYEPIQAGEFLTKKHLASVGIKK